LSSHLVVAGADETAPYFFAGGGGGRRGGEDDRPRPRRTYVGLGWEETTTGRANGSAHCLGKPRAHYGNYELQ
jgi:hypothetical protein